MAYIGHRGALWRPRTVALSTCRPDTGARQSRRASTAKLVSYRLGLTCRVRRVGLRPSNRKTHGHTATRPISSEPTSSLGESNREIFVSPARLTSKPANGDCSSLMKKTSVRLFTLSGNPRARRPSLTEPSRHTERREPENELRST